MSVLIGHHLRRTLAAELLTYHGQNLVHGCLPFVGEAEAKGPVTRLHFDNNGIGWETLPPTDDGEGVVEVDDAARRLGQALLQLLGRVARGRRVELVAADGAGGVD